MDLFLAKLFTNADDKTNNNMPQVLLWTYFRLSYLLMQMIRQINNMLQVLLMYSARCWQPWGTSQTDQDDDQDLAKLRRKRESHRG